MKKLDGVSSEAAEEATGYGWDKWLSTLDDAGAKDWNHKEIVAYLKDNYHLSGWWQQTVTVAYEKAKGRRVVGQTADSGFQIGVSKTIPIGLDDAWKLLVSRKGLNCWLGKVARLRLEEGRAFETDTGITGEIRVVKPGTRVRLTWQKPRMEQPATLQITLAAGSPEKTSFRIHVERLESQKQRNEMKSYWKSILEQLG